MSTKLRLFVLIFFLISEHSSASQPGWESFAEERILETSCFGSNVWILTNHNIIKFDLISQQKIIYDKNNTGIFFGCNGHLYVDLSGRVWVSCCTITNPATGQSYVLAMYDGNQWTKYTSADLGSGFSPYVVGFTEDPAGTVFIAHRSGFTTYSNGTFQSYSIPPVNWYTPEVNAITLDLNAEVWLATSVGYLHYDGTQFVDFALPGKSTFYSGLGNWGEVDAIDFDQNGVIWLGSATQSSACNGLYKFENGQFTKYDSTNSPLSSWNVRQIHIDRNNVKWISNNSRIYWFDNNAFATIPQIDSLGTIMSYSIDPHDVKWFNGYSSDLLSFDNQHYKNYNFNTNTLSNDIRNLAIDSSGVAYFGYQPGNGIPYYDGSNWNHIDIPGHSSNTVIVGIDRNNVLWAVCKGRDVHRYDGTIWTTFDNTNSPLGNCNFYDIYIDELNRPWLNTQTDGMVYYFENNIWHSLDLRPIVNDPNVYIQTIGFSPGGISWIATNNQGLVRYDGTNTFLYLMPELMYPNGYIYQISYSPVYGLMFLLNNNSYSGIKILNGFTVTALDSLNSHLYANFLQYHTAYNFVTVDSSIWLCGPDGAMYWDGTNFTIYDQFNSDFYGNGGFVIAKDELGKIYVGGEYLNIYTPAQITTGAESSEMNVGINIFPNPVTNYLQVTSKMDMEEWKIIDLTGRIIQQSGKSNERKSFNIQLSDNLPGIYLLEISTLKQKHFYKIIKQ